MTNKDKNKDCSRERERKREERTRYGSIKRGRVGGEGREGEGKREGGVKE